MLRKKERILDNYMKIGAEMRLFKALSTRLVVEIDSVLSAKGIDKMLNALNSTCRADNKSQ